jgi:hypothetical protein
MSSTMTVDSLLKDDVSNSLPQSSSRRRVHFDETNNVYHANTVMDRDEINELWSTGAEMRQFKQQTSILAKEINRAEKVNVAPFSYHRVVLGAYDACCRMTIESNASFSPLTEAEMKHFNKWMEVSISRIGLERICIREIAQDKYARRAHVVDAVLEVQENLHPCTRDGDELMRKASQHISRASRLFAFELAKAQAASSTQ